MTSATVFAIRISCAGWVVEKIQFWSAECTFYAKAKGCAIFDQAFDCAAIVATERPLAHFGIVVLKN
jgi:hypothetical protein